MAKRHYATSREEAALLDELLCEYVDGTIDQAVRAAFDECMSADKSLAERVQCLRRTRHLLKQYRCRDTRGVQQRVRERVEREVRTLQDDLTMLEGLSPFVGAGTKAALALCTLLIAGTAGHVPSPSIHDRVLPTAAPAAFTMEIPMTPLRGPVPKVPVTLASGPPWAPVTIAAFEIAP